MRISSRLLVLVLVLGLVALPLAGCGDKIAEEVLEGATDAEVDVEDGGESITITGEDGEMTIETGEGASMPDGFPSDVPVMDGDVTASTSITTDEGTILSVILMIDDTADEAKAFFEQELAAEGWNTIFSTEHDDGTQHTISFSVEKDERTTNIVIVDDGESVVVSYSVLAEG